jgi:hypothetical protein
VIINAAAYGMHRIAGLRLTQKEETNHGGVRHHSLGGNHNGSHLQRDALTSREPADVYQMAPRGVIAAAYVLR